MHTHSSCDLFLSTCLWVLVGGEILRDNTALEQMDFQITMGNRTKCTPIGRGTIAFQMEAGTGIRATIVLHMPMLGMNLISVSQLQDKGYDVYFIGKKVYVKHPRWKKKRQIGA